MAILILAISDSITKLNVRQLTCIMSIRQGTYTQYCPDRQTKCSLICFALKFAKCTECTEHINNTSLHSHFNVTMVMSL